MINKLIIILFLLFLSKTIYSQDNHLSQIEIDKLIISHLYDSVTIKGRVIEPMFKNIESNSTIPHCGAILDLYYLSTLNRSMSYHYIQNHKILSLKSDKNGYFKFKMARGKYVISLYTYDFDCLSRKIYINIGDKEVVDGVINLNDM